MNQKIITVQSVRGYIGADGTAYLNAEDVARGLGFVHNQTVNGKEYSHVRWSTINDYLKGFGFCQDVGKDDFLPENMFYRLAMKASNETAQAFQAKVADEILPEIRKTGTYSIRPNVPTPCADAVLDVGLTVEHIQKFFPHVKYGIALAQAIDFIAANRDLNCDPLKTLLPPADHDTGYLNATQIGEKLGLGKGRVAAVKANKLLADIALQIKAGKSWRLTDEGSAYGEELPYSKNGHSDYQIKWNDSVIDLLNAARHC